MQWQIVALVGEEIAGGTEIPDVPSAPEPQYYSASWTAPAQSARGSFDLTFTVNTDKYQLNTLEKVDGAVITVTPSQTSGSVDGGSWKMTPAGAQTITTSGHTQDDNYHLNGGDGSATWTSLGLLTRAQMQRILDNLATVRAAYYTLPGTPNIPTAPSTLYSAINDMEQVLWSLHELWQRNSVKRYAGEICAGQEIGVI